MLTSVALARAKAEVQDIVKREWLAAGAKGKTRSCLARFRGEGIQKRETIELPSADNGSHNARVLGSSKPQLMLTDGSESLADRSADFGNAYGYRDLFGIDINRIGEIRFSNRCEEKSEDNECGTLRFHSVRQDSMCDH